MFCTSACGETPSVDLPPVTDETPVPPQTPQEPIEPQEPVVPEQPTEPNVPSEPTTPTEPQEPSTPSEPSEPTEPETPEQPFDVTTAENIAKLETNLARHLGKLAQFIDINATVNETYYLYLKEGESGIVDTIGVVASVHSSLGSNCLVYGEITCSNITADLTYQSICEEGIEYIARATTATLIYAMSVSREEESQYQEVVDIIEKQTFGEDCQTAAEWIGWRGTNGTGADTHSVIMLKDNKIHYVRYGITNDYTTLSMLEAVKQNFEGKEPSEELDYDGSYIIADSQEITIPADALNLKAIKANNQQNG
ncbi:MAG: hypothetical protein J6C93_00325 [Clostridia bacterium]|nr:hypothetical protein [Clostridia bacterium]